MAFDKQDPMKLLKPDALTAVIDLDFVKYAAASVGDKRWITVKHIKSGKEADFDGREQFWGRKGNGGWLVKQNEKRVEGGLEPYTIGDFEITDKTEPKDPIENILHSAKAMIESAIKASGAEQYIAFYGKGEPDRVQRSTLLEYKGNRKGTPKPSYLDEVTDYIAFKFDGEKVIGIECDDKVVQIAYDKPNYFVLGIDKDYRGSGANFFDVNHPEEGIINTRGLGELFLRDNGKVSGRGLLFKLWQMCSQDTIDNYKANCFSDIKWGEKSAYKALKDCQTEQEAWQAAVEVFKKLYPEPKTVTGWRGDDIEIDWMYVMQEMFDLAHMQRWENDLVDIQKTLDNLGVKYD